MDFFLSLVSPISEATGIPITVTALLSLFLLGLTGHFIIRRSVQRLGVFADTTDTRWDDVVYYSISPPAEWAMWVCLIFGSLTLFEEAESIRQYINSFFKDNTLEYLCGSKMLIIFLFG